MLILTVVAMVVAVVSLAVAVLALRRTRTSGGVGRPVRRRVTHADGGDAALRHVALVRYDAFADVGGRMSFSVALLDDNGDGLVLTSIHTRNESRTYAKSLTSGTSAQELSGEEREAIDAAWSSATRRGGSSVEPQVHTGGDNPMGDGSGNEQPVAASESASSNEQDAS